MTVAVVTGSAGLVGSEAARHFAAAGLDVVGLDNDFRGRLFGAEASTASNRGRLLHDLPRYTHVEEDIRSAEAVGRLFDRLGRDVAVVVHAAAQPSHDWAAQDVRTDFEINALATLHLLEATRRHAPDAVFVFLSSSKVYGDTPNRLPFVETPTRWELPADHPLFAGVTEAVSIDQCTHSFMGVSKAAADLLVQEYGRYFGLRTVCFRCGCLTGPAHAGTEMHGFLAYLVRCAVERRPYTVIGYQGKQVRDNLHVRDLLDAIARYVAVPQPGGAVYNLGGGRVSNTSVLEAIALSEELTGRPMAWSYTDKARRGDHLWYVTDTAKFRRDYPGWSVRYDTRALLRELSEVRHALPGGSGG